MPDEFVGLPELTLSLRSLGSPRAGAGAEQGQFFSALLDARRRAASAKSMSEVVGAFSVARLGSALDETLRAFAAARFPDRPPRRRAFEAELVDDAQPLYAALRALREATPAAAGAISDESWQRWLATLRGVFESADRAWRAMETAMGRVPPAKNAEKGTRTRGGGEGKSR